MRSFLMAISIRSYYLTIPALIISSFAQAQERREIPEYKVYGVAESRAEANQVERLISDYKLAWKELDAENFISLHTADTEWTNAFARIFQSSHALEQFLQTSLFPQFEQAFSENDGLVIETISLRYLSNDAVVIHLYTEFQGDSRSTNETRRTHFHLVAQQKDSTWEIAHTAIMDAR